MVVGYCTHLRFPALFNVVSFRAGSPTAEAAAAAAAQDRLDKGAGPRRPPFTSMGGSSSVGGGDVDEDGAVLHVRWAAEDPNPRAGQFFVPWCACVLP